MTAEYRLGPACIKLVQHCHNCQCPLWGLGAPHICPKYICHTTKRPQLLYFLQFLSSVWCKPPQVSMCCCHICLHCWPPHASSKTCQQYYSSKSLSPTSPHWHLMHWQKPAPSPQTLLLFLLEHTTELRFNLPLCGGGWMFEPCSNLYLLFIWKVKRFFVFLFLDIISQCTDGAYLPYDPWHLCTLRVLTLGLSVVSLAFS